jgi:ABC-2 type transport system permease protein
MQPYLTLVRRELASYFFSVTGYIIIGGTMFLIGLSFVDLLVNLQREATPIPVTEVFYITPFFWYILLLSTPVITMRLYAQEKFSGTFETLMTAPVNEYQVVLAKFTAAVMFYLVMWLPLLGCLFVVRHFASDPTALEPLTVTSTFLGILLLGCLFVSAGCFASALTRSQVVAAMVSLGFGAVVFLVAVLAEHVTTPVTWQAQALATLAFFSHMHDFARGIIDTRPIVLYLTLTVFFLFLTLRVVESRRWK